MLYVLYAIHIVFNSVCMKHMINLQQYFISTVFVIVPIDILLQSYLIERLGKNNKYTCTVHYIFPI